MSNAVALELLISIMLASLGGVVRRLVEQERHPRKNRPFSYFLIGAVISTFTGGVIWLLCKSLGLAEFPTAFFSTLSGYGGSPILDKLQKISMKKLEDKVGYKEEDKNEK